MRKPSFQQVLCGVAALGTLSALGLMILGHSFLGSERGREVVEYTKLALRAAGSPGSPELARIGCEQSVVLKLGDIVSAGSSTFPPEVRARISLSDARNAPVVMCQNFWGSNPDCTVVAESYRAFDPPGDAFIVMVQVGRSVLCSGIYSPKGGYMGPVSRFEELLGSR